MSNAYRGGNENENETNPIYSGCALTLHPRSRQGPATILEPNEFNKPILHTD